MSDHPQVSPKLLHYAMCMITDDKRPIYNIVRVFYNENAYTNRYCSGMRVIVFFLLGDDVTINYYYLYNIADRVTRIIHNQLQTIIIRVV